MAKLYRFYKGGLERVPCQATSLSAHAAYLLIAPQTQKLCLFLGGEVGRVDQAKAEALADSVRVDLRIRTLYRVQQSSLDASCSEEAGVEFWQQLGVKTPSPAGVNRVISNKQPRNGTHRMWTIAQNNKGNYCASPLCEVVPDSNGALRPIAAPPMDNASMYLLMSDGLECFLWIGSKVPTEIRSAAKEFAARHIARNGGSDSSEVVVIKARMEPAVFMQQLGSGARGSLSITRESIRAQPLEPSDPNLTGAQALARRRNTIDVKLETEIRRRSSSTIAVGATDDKKRPINREVERMTNEFMGTMGMVTNGVGDNLRSLKMKLIDDESGVVRVWAIRGRSSELQEVPENFQGIFESTGAYGILYTCKAGARAVLYLWIGNDCPATRRAAIALQAKDILQRYNVTGAIEQVPIDQGREPMFFLSLMAMKAGPYLVMNDAIFDEHPGNINCIVEVLSLDLGIQYEAAFAYQCHRAEFQARGALTSRSYILVNGNAGNMSVQVLKGPHSPAHVVEATDRRATMIAEFFGCCVDDVEWYDARQTFTGLGVKVALHQVSATSSRPRRLWYASNARRALGAAFVAEVGQGGGFLQADLEAGDSYIADPGDEVIYVWHGPEADLATRYLATRVVKEFVQRLNLGGALAADSEPVRIEHIESTKEPPEFVALFKSWDPRKQTQAEKRMLDYFKPSAVPDQDDLGHVALPEPPKPEPVKPAKQPAVETVPAGDHAPPEPASRGCCTIM